MRFGWLPTLAVACALSSCCTCRTATPEQKLASLAAIADLSIDDKPLMYFAQRRSALVIAGAPVQTAEPRNGSWALAFPPEVPRCTQIELATAVALSRDGYFLTCAHALGRTPRFLCVSGDGETSCAPLRVVWCGDAARTSTDFAIVHAGLEPGSVCDWADPHEVESGSPVVGWGMGGSFGHMTSAYISRSSRGVTSSTAYHDMPTIDGDSGGPVMTIGGKIIGINSRIKGSTSHSGETEIVRPDVAWMERVMESDRRALLK